MKKPAGVILFEGPSKLDGQPIVAIATFASNNAKTGNMIQTWILRADHKPTQAANLGLDGSVCGSCPHRRSLGGACYVNLGQGPRAVYESYKKGNYPQLTASLMHLFEGRKVRLGSYGDPAAVSYRTWKAITDVADGHTGYTHQAHTRAFDKRLLELVMVSADTPKQAAKIQAAGNRTFRVKTPEAPLLAGEVECLADSKGISCLDCGLCDGANDDAPNVAITVHGSLSGRYTAKYSKANLIPALAV